jgi:hypothetical protein
MQYWISVVSYPVNVGGKPYHSWPAFIVPTFELTILFAGIFAVFGMLALNGLPMPYHPVFNVPRFRVRERRTGFFLIVFSSDPKYNPVEVRRCWKAWAALHIGGARLSRGASNDVGASVRARAGKSTTNQRGDSRPRLFGRAKARQSWYGPPTTTSNTAELRSAGQPGAAVPAWFVIARARTLAPTLRIAMLLAALLLLAGCRQDMHDQPRFKPFARSDFYTDLRSARPPVEGTVARGELREDTYLYTGKNRQQSRRLHALSGHRGSPGPRTAALRHLLRALPLPDGRWQRRGSLAWFSAQAALLSHRAFAQGAPWDTSST